MKKAEKIYLWSCGALLLICLLFNKFLRILFISDTHMVLGFFFAILAAIYLNVFAGVKGGVERFWFTVLVIAWTVAIVGGLFQGIYWITDHVRIIP